VIAAAANHPLTRRRKIELAELLDEPWTLQPHDNNFGRLL
jgi:DNA-binding transcriptional LysR family regulator